MILGISSSLVAGLAENLLHQFAWLYPTRCSGLYLPVTAALMSITLGISYWHVLSLGKSYRQRHRRARTRNRNRRYD